MAANAGRIREEGMPDYPFTTLAHAKKQAKQLLADARTGHIDACDRFWRQIARLERLSVSDIASAVTLREAQHTLAREQGLPDWAALRRILEKQLPDTSDEGSKGYLQLVWALPDDTTLELHIAGEVVLEGVQYWALHPPRPKAYAAALPPGEHEVSVTRNGVVLYESVVHVSANRTQRILGYGDPAQPSFCVVPDSETYPPPGEYCVTVLHASPSAPPLMVRGVGFDQQTRRALDSGFETAVLSSGDWSAPHVFRCDGAHQLEFTDADGRMLFSTQMHSQPQTDRMIIITAPPEQQPGEAGGLRMAPHSSAMSASALTAFMPCVMVDRYAPEVEAQMLEMYEQAMRRRRHDPRSRHRRR
ncbi:MAG: DUF4397 domain-containing protein [Bacteroidota bacterium]